MSNSMSKALQTILTRTEPRVSHTDLPKEASMVSFPKRSDVKPQEQPIEKYIPKRAVHDPVKLGSQTVQAVDVIGQIATTNIENVITEIERGSEELCNELKLIADQIRINTIEASSRVAAYCDRVNGLVTGIRHVQDLLQPVPSRELAIEDINIRDDEPIE